MLTMLTVCLPEHSAPEDELNRLLRVTGAFGLDAKGVANGKVVWAVADTTADKLKPVSYREYDWTDVDTLCIGADMDVLFDTDLIKPEHDVVTIPGMGYSLYGDQALAILLEHYVHNYPSKKQSSRTEKFINRRLKWRQEKEQDNG